MFKKFLNEIEQKRAENATLKRKKKRKIKGEDPAFCAFYKKTCHRHTGGI